MCYRKWFELIFFSLLLLTCNVALAKEADKSYKLDKVVVTGTKTPHTLKDTPVETTLISEEDIERTNANNLMEVLNEIPGIYTGMHNDVFGTYTWESRMRGMSFNDGYGLVLVDGQRVMGGGQSGGMGEYGIGLNQIPVNMIKRIEVVKGPGSALYGSDAAAGVINIITKETPEKATLEAGAQHGWYDVRTKSGKDMHIGKSSQGYFSYGDSFDDRLGSLLHFSHEESEGVDNEKEDQKRNYGLGKIHADLSKYLNVTLKGEASKYEEHPETGREKKDEDSYRISGQANITPNQDNSIILSGYTYKWDFVSGYPGYSHGYKHGDIGFNKGELQYTAHLSDWNTITMGGEFRQQIIDYLIENPDGSTIPVDEEVNNAAFYLQDEITLLQDLTIVPGVRYDDHSDFGGETNPKLSLMYKLSPNTTLRGSAGRIYKSPTIRQLYYSEPYEHGNYYIRSNPNLDPEKGWGYTFNIQRYLLNNKILFNLGLFRNDLEDKVVRQVIEDEYKNTGKELKTYKNVQEVYVQGVEVNLKARPTNYFSCNLAYTYTDSENREYDKELPYTPTHTASLSPQYRIRKYGLGINSQISYTSEQYPGLENKNEIDDFFTLDGEIYKKINSRAKISMEIDNILNSDKATEDPDDTLVGRSFTVKIKGTF